MRAAVVRQRRQPPLDLDLARLPTTAVVDDIVYVPLETQLLAAARARGVWVNALGARTLRALTHRDVTRAQCLAAAEVLLQSVEANAA